MYISISKPMGMYFNWESTKTHDWQLDRRRPKLTFHHQLFFMALLTLFMVIADVSLATHSSVSVIEGITGGTAKLHCKVSPESENESPILVLWYKDGSRLPFFTLDLRDGGPTQFIDDAIRLRVRSDVTGEFLTINSLFVSDSGFYKCKVDYHNSPSLEAKGQLIVYEPPSQILIQDEVANVITGPVIGPINQDSRLRLFCISIGGVPLPNVSWWWGSTQLTNQTLKLEDIRPSLEEEIRPTKLKSTIMRSSFSLPNLLRLDKDERIVVSELNIIKVGRKLAGQILTCKATNNNISSHLEKAIILNIHLRPKVIKIIEPKNHLRENITTKLKCETSGSYPSVKISWEQTRKDKSVIFESKQINLKDNVSESLLNFTPKAEDHLGLLTCRAHNPNLPGAPIKYSIALDIHYIPRVSLKMGKNLAHQSIKEGDDVYFDCEISSNPRLTLITWHKSGIEVEQNLKSGIIVSGRNLVLQRIHRNSAGNYTCSVRNEIGTTVSNSVGLKVMYLPVCDTKTVKVAVAEDEGVKLLCKVAARPSTNLTFVWLFNNTLDTVIVDTARVVVKGPISYIDYTPVSPRDYGTLSCWARNEVGMQAEPCKFTVIEAGQPGEVNSCILFNHTVDSLEVQCLPGSNGGSAQNFVAKVFVASTHTMLAELKSKTPVFKVTGLSQGQDYIVTVTAFNNKGSSKPIEIDANRLKVAEKRMVDMKNTSVSPMVVIGIFLRVVGGFILLLVVGLVISKAKISRSLCFRRKQVGKRRNEPQDGSINLGELNHKGEEADKREHISSFSISKTIHEGTNESPDIIKASNENSFLLNAVTRQSHLPVTLKSIHTTRSPLDELKPQAIKDPGIYLQSQSPINLPSDESFV